MNRKLSQVEKKRYIAMIDSFSKRELLKAQAKANWFITDETIDNDYAYCPYTIYTDKGYEDELSLLGYFDIVGAKSKGELKDQAIYYQRWASEQNLSMFEICEYNNYFERLGKRYGLLKEFRENGII